ncbi:MAG: hypothetical protein IPP61_00530 [Cytophagaceae bacterium]|nr:hypothetical protein [Cytophagaceae bacterium]MBL0304282.1 hypothetical protein [Cytophagaceae bacterium]MBL0323666.1 hypothetical protein [Cytophagaceae bacterium]
MEELEFKGTKENFDLNQKDLWIDENIDRLSEEFEEYWSSEILYSGSVWDIDKDAVREEFFDEKYSESIAIEKALN